MNDVKYPELPKAEGAFETTDDGRWVEAPAGADSARLTPLYSDDQMRSYADATCALRGADEARQFPDNTCPASRHAQMIGEALVKGEAFPQLSEEPEHCGQSILATVEALYKARTALRGAQKESHAAPGAPQQEASDCQYAKDVGMWPEHRCAVKCQYADDHSSEARLWRAARAVASQAGEPADKFIEWLCNGGFAEMAISHFSRAAATAPAGGVTPAAIAEAAGSKYAPVLQWLESIGIAATLNQSLPALQVIVAALTTAARAAEPDAKQRGLQLLANAKKSAIESGARQAYNNHYHKIKADIGYDDWLMVWKKAIAWWSEPVAASPTPPTGTSEPEHILDYCTDPDNCARCKTHPDHRGDMEHAGIGKRPPWPPTGTSKEGSE